jgi:hypothetical protein
MWIAIHKCMEATLGNSLYSSLSLSQTSKNTMSFLLSPMFSLPQCQRTRELKRFGLRIVGLSSGGWGGHTNNVYTYK